MRYIDTKHKKLDKHIADLSIKSDILKFVDPLNKFEELETFLSKDGHYTPRFVYSDKHIPAIKHVLKYINQLSQKVDNYMQRYQDNLTKLMIEKCEELEHKFLLLMAYHEQDIDKIVYHNQALFGRFGECKDIDLDHPNLSKHNISDISDFVPQDIVIWDGGRGTDLTGWVLDKQGMKQIVWYHLDRIGISDYKIKLEQLGKTNMQVSIGKRPTIYINKRSAYHISSIVVSVLHEVYWHLSRRANWSDTDIHILQWGTGYYLSHEEWVATFQWARYEWYKTVYDRLSANYILWSKIAECGRDDAVEMVRSTKFKKLENIFWSLLRWKRGIVDVDKHYVFYKDKIYLDGFLDICEFVINGWDIDDMYVGRVKISDLGYIDKN